MNLAEFENIVLIPSQIKPVIVDFWATWCDPCKILDPILDGLALENSDTWSLIKIDTDESKDIATKYDIMGVPAIRIFNKGELIGKFNGLMWKKDMERWIGEQLERKV